MPRRTLGRTGHQVVPLVLGGIDSIAHPARGISAAEIVVRAIELGIDYLDTSNVYGSSQMLYGEAFRRLHLTPADSHYDRARRERLFVATKTMGRFSNQQNPAPPFPKDPPPGFTGPWPPQLPPEFRNSAIDDLKRSLTQMFGDGEGDIPEGCDEGLRRRRDVRRAEAVPASAGGRDPHDWQARGGPSADLVRYSASLPGVTCAVIGIGHIDRERPENDQIVANLAAGRERHAVARPADAHRARRRRAPGQGHELLPGSDCRDRAAKRGAHAPGRRSHRGPLEHRIPSAEPIRSYEVRAGERVPLSLPFRPQLTEEPFRVTVAVAEVGAGPITVTASTAEPRRRA